MYVDYNNRNSWNVDIDKDRQLRCYANYNLFWTPIGESTSSGWYTKCIQTGSGWSRANKKASFSVQGAYDVNQKALGPGVDVTVYSSDRAVFFPNGNYPSWAKPCVVPGYRLNQTVCDWDRIFSPDPDSPVLNRTQNVNTMEYTLQKTNGSSIKFVVDFTAYMAFTEYSIDPSPVSNPMGLIQTQDLPNYGESVAIDPSWVLAAWAVDVDGELQPNRTSTNLLQQVMQQMLNDQKTGLATDDFNVDFVALVPVLQTLSMIDHSTEYITNPASVADKDPERPLLIRYARMNVWGYSVTSRTAWLGVIVAILGCVVVICQVVLGFWDRRRYRSPTQLLVAALEHAPHGEFAGKAHDEKEMARVRFHIQDDDNPTGKFSFYEPDSPHVHGAVEEK